MDTYEDFLYKQYKRARNQIAITSALIALTAIVAAILIANVLKQPIESFYVTRWAIPEQKPEYNYSTAEELDYYHDLAELEERSMAMLMEFQQPTQEWFDTYKQMSAMYEDVGMPDQVSDEYKVDEMTEFAWVVENETRGASFEAKVNVCNVIWNRLNHPKFPNTLHGVLSQPNQFTYHPSAVTEETRQAIEYSYAFADTTNGALFFQRSSIPPKGLEWIMDDDSGHDFFTYAGLLNKEETEEAIVEEEPETTPTPADIITEGEVDNYEELLEESVG